MEYQSSPKRPYLLRAYYDWLIDNDFTPYLVVDASYWGVKVPMEYVKDGQIVFEPEEAYAHPEQAEDQPIGFEKAVDKTDKPKKATKSTSHLRIVK